MIFSPLIPHFWFCFVLLTFFLLKVDIHERAESWTEPNNITTVYTGMIRKSLLSMNRANHWIIRGNLFFVGFSTKHEGIQGDIWTTISTNSAIFWNLHPNLFLIKFTLHAGLTTNIARWITSNLKIYPNNPNMYKLANIRIMALLTAWLDRVSVPLCWSFVLRFPCNFNKSVLNSIFWILTYLFF